MCGIFGIIPSIPENEIRYALSKIAHRGPDDEGVWSDGVFVSFGHRRLSILDLSPKGHQPMHDKTGRYTIIFNGEVFNFIEIREELIKKGYTFTSNTDTEVVLYAFIEWKEACLRRFNGMWALSIWDKERKSLFLARDRFGEKPLFYAQKQKGELVFASEMKAVMPFLNEIEVNRNLVTDRTKLFLYESSEECLIKGVSRFPAGHFAWYENQNLNITRWWSTLDNIMNVPEDYHQQVEQFREIFIDACKIRMRSDVPIGTALSGGLDSSATISTVAYLANKGEAFKANQSWQHAFVAVFPGTPIDESKYAKMVTDHLGIKSTFIEIDPLKSISALDNYFYLIEDLYITSPIPFMQTYAAMKESGVSVTLDGHGADELFSGYSFDTISAIKDAGINIREAYDIVDTVFSSYPKDSSQFRKLPSKLRYIIDFYLRDFYYQNFRNRGFKSVVTDIGHHEWNKLGNLNQRLYESTHKTVLPTLLRNYDRYSMANGVEIRMPFMDYRIVSFAFSIPWKSKVRNGYMKAIVRDAVAPFMPTEIAWRKSKVGFNSPMVDWLKGPLKTHFLDTLASNDCKQCDLIDYEKAYKSITNVISNPNAKFTEAETAWSLLSPYFWEKGFVKHDYSIQK